MNEPGRNDAMSEVLDVLLVEDDPEDARLLIEITRHRSYGDVDVRFTVAETLSEAILMVEADGDGHFDAIALDVTLPDARGVIGVQTLRASAPDLPIVVVTGARDAELARRAIAAGAQDYLIKGADDGELLVRSLRFAVERQRLQDEQTRTAALLAERADELMVANTRLTADADARDELLAVVSHELRTPLTPIYGFAELLMAQLGDRMVAEEAAMLAAIARNSQRMQTHLDQLLSMSRLRRTADVEPVDVSRRPVALAPLLTQLVDEQLPMGTAVTVVVPEDIRVYANRVHLEQMVSNLIVNAAKYGRPPIEVTATVTGAYTAIEVVDHGDGVPPAFEPHLFARFRQASTGTRRTATGIGLGLYLARQLALLHDGSLAYVRTEDGSGARFVLTLPTATATGDDTARFPTDHATADDHQQARLASQTSMAAARHLLHAGDATEVALILERTIHQLGGALVPIVEAGSDAIQLDVSLGLTTPMLTVPRDELSHARLQRMLPILLEDAQAALRSVEARQGATTRPARSTGESATT